MRINLLICYNFTFLLFLTFKLSYCDFPLYFLYTRTDPSNFTQVTDRNINNGYIYLGSSPYSATKKTYLIIHGWNGYANNDWVLKIKDNILTKEDANVFAVDWSEASSGALYPVNALAVGLCAYRISDFINKTSIQRQNIHCIGHSLGAHVCGYTGKKGILGRITGMDPAGPAFKGNWPNDRLDKSDATYVDIIHTDATFGIQDPIGHKNFYPNGGEIQAGCLVGKREGEENSDQNGEDKGEFDLVPFLSCSHTRVTHLYAESIISPCRFVSTSCKNYNDFSNKKCSCADGSCVSMGHYSHEVATEGNFYLNTNNKEPYCIN